jgi:hypothetical protein
MRHAGMQAQRSVYYCRFTNPNRALLLLYVSHNIECSMQAEVEPAWVQASNLNVNSHPHRLGAFKKALIFPIGM